MMQTMVIDEIGGGLKIIQDKEKFCFGIDAVLLADYARNSTGKIIDLCAGNGIVPLLMYAKSEKSKDSEFSAIEIQSESFELMKKSIELNGIEEKIRAFNGDLKDFKKLFVAESYDTVTCNPPFFKVDSGRKNGNDFKLIARHEIKCCLEDVVEAASFLLKSNGRFFMIHRPERLSEIFQTLCRYRLEVKRIRFVHPFCDKGPTMVLFECVKNGRAGVTVEKPLIIYEKTGGTSSYTCEVREIYGDSLK